MAHRVRPVILAGGAGTRLWPISTEACPKHLLHLFGTGSLLEQTLERVSDAALFRSPTIVCAALQEAEIRRIAPYARLILEPCARSSAASIALAAIREEPDAIMLVLPSDHHIADPRPLLAAVQNARSVADSGRIITFGIEPTKAETGYGYITAGAALGNGVHEVVQFVEKPSQETAESLISRGNCYWNAGIFMFKPAVLLEELQQYAPRVLDAVRAAIPEGGAAGAADNVYPDRAAMESCPSISIDYAVMERSARVAVAPIQMDWSDVGSWGSVFDIAAKDDHQNVLDERSSVLGSHRCLVRSTGPRVVAIGVEDLIVVATANHVLVVNRFESQRVREAANKVATAETPLSDAEKH